MPVDSAIQNLVIQDITQSLIYNYPLDEGSGTDAINIDPSTQGNFLDQPMWDTDILEGDANRYIEIPRLVIPDGDDYQISFDWIRQDLTGSSTNGLLGEFDENSYLSIRDTGNANANQFTFRPSTGATFTIDNAVAGVALGQHARYKITQIGGTYTLYIDDVVIDSQVLATPDLIVNVLYVAATTGQKLPVGSALQNVVIENLTTDEFVHYKIDEGAGTEILAYDENGNVIQATPEEIIDGTFDQGLTHWPNPAGFNNSVTSNVLTIDRNGAGNVGAPNAGSSIVQGTRYILQFDLISASHNLQARAANSLLPGDATFTSADIGSVTLDFVATGSHVGEFQWWATGSADSAAEVANVSITEYYAKSGTVTPDASWSTTPEYSNDGSWTPDTDWQNIPDNSRHYPMEDGTAGAGTLVDVIGGHDATIVNYDSNSWVDIHN
jgi:hypothetical protein